MLRILRHLPLFRLSSLERLFTLICNSFSLHRLTAVALIAAMLTPTPALVSVHK